MNLLIDTHTFLWFIAGSEKLSNQAKNLIEDETNQVYLSVASLWELANKVSLGKLSFSEPFEDFIPEQLNNNSIELLGIDTRHASKVASLPFHHRDPFDRLLVAQALSNEIPMISADEMLDLYGINRIW